MSVQPDESNGATPKSRRSSSGYRVRALVLSGILLTECAVLLAVVRRDPILARAVAETLGRHHPAVPVIAYKRLTANDPRIGAVAPTVRASADCRSAVSGRRAALMIPVGDCASCVGVDLAAWERDCERAGVATILITSASREDAERFKNTLHLRASIVCDRHGELLRWLNATWPGRAYLLSPDLRLLWIQKDGRSKSYNPLADAEAIRSLGGAGK